MAKIPSLNYIYPPFHVFGIESTLEKRLSVWKMSTVPYCLTQLTDRSPKDLPATQEHTGLAGRDQNSSKIELGSLLRLSPALEQILSHITVFLEES